MPRMSKQEKEEWDFFLDENGRITYNELCRKCDRECKQSFRAAIVSCPEYHTTGGEDTKDKIFIISYEEFNEYFPNYEYRQCKATDYAVSKGSYADDNGYTSWLLRSLLGQTNRVQRLSNILALKILRDGVLKRSFLSVLHYG